MDRRTASVEALSPDERSSEVPPGIGVSSADSDPLELFSRLTAQINEGIEVDELLESFHEGFRDLVPFDRLEYAIVEPDEHTLRTIWVSTELDSGLLSRGHRYTRSVPVTGSTDYARTFLTGDMVAYAADRSDEHPTSILVADGFVSSLSCPLVVRGRVVGFVFFNSRSCDAYTARHVDLVQQVAGLMAFALEQSRLNAELADHNQMLREHQALRIRLIASVSHELRTPLTGVLGLAAELADDVGRFTPEEVAEFAALIAEQSSEAASIVEDLLVAARAEADSLPVHLATVDLASEIRAVIDSTVASGECTVQLPDQGVHAWADSQRVRQVIRNLYSNALRFGGPTIRIVARSSEQGAEVLVADDGPGIPVTERTRVFEAFTRLGGDLYRPGSIGLGLSVARMLAEAMGGSLVYTRDSGWSHFTLTLPAAEGAHRRVAS